jgi:hypothetical protein
MEWSNLLLIVALGTAVKLFFYTLGFSIKKYQERAKEQ